MKGQDILADDFGTGAFSLCLVEGMDDKDVVKLKKQMEQVDNVDSVIWYDSIMDIAIPDEILPKDIREAYRNDDCTMMAIIFKTTMSSDETMEAEDKAFLLKLRDTTMAAIDESRFSQVVGRLQESMAVPITGKVQDVVQLTAQSYGINAEEQEGILKYLIEGGDLSLYGLSNAVTRASQDVVSYDRATTLEGIGWQVATMEPQQWKQINQ